MQHKPDFDYRGHKIYTFQHIMAHICAKWKHLIYHFDIIIQYHDYIYFNLLSSFYKYCQCVRFERIPNQVWSFIHQLIENIVGFAFWYY